MESLLLDTDIIVDHLRGVEEAKKVLKRIEKGEVKGFFSTITEAELFAGKSMHRREEQRKVSALLGTMKRVPLSSAIARKAGEIRRKHDVLLPDAIIAATALTVKAALTTKNSRHYRGIKVKVKKPY